MSSDTAFPTLLLNPAAGARPTEVFKVVQDDSSLSAVKDWTDADWLAWRRESKARLKRQWQESGLWNKAKPENAIVLTDLDGTLSPFPDLQLLNEGEPAKYWLSKSEEAVQKLKVVDAHVLVSTGNPLGMVRDRYTEALDSGVFAGGADVRWKGVQVNKDRDGTCSDCLTEAVVKATIDVQDKHRDFLCVWMNPDTYYMDTDLAAVVKDSGSDVTVWEDAKSYLTANVMPGTPKKEEVLSLFQGRVRDIRQRVSGADDIQVLYLKGFGHQDKDKSKLARVLKSLLPELSDRELQEYISRDKAMFKGNVKSSVVMITLMQTSGRWEASVMMDGVTKETGQRQLKEFLKRETGEDSFSDKVTIVAGDSNNDLPNAAAVMQGAYPNAIFVATANSKWELSPAVTGLGRQARSPLTPTAIQEQCTDALACELEKNKNRIMPGFVFDAMDILAARLRASASPLEEAAGSERRLPADNKRSRSQ